MVYVFESEVNKFSDDDVKFQIGIISLVAKKES